MRFQQISRVFRKTERAARVDGTAAREAIFIQRFTSEIRVLHKTAWVIGGHKSCGVC